jgi:hypothetical protein
MPSTLPATPMPGRSFPGGSQAPLPAYNAGPGAGPNHVLTGADTAAAPATSRTPAGPTLVTRPTAQRTLVGTPSGGGSVATPGSQPQLPVRAQGQGPAEGSVAGAPPVQRRVSPPTSLYQGSPATLAEQPAGPTVVRPGGGSYTQTTPTTPAGRAVYGGGREYTPPATVAPAGPAYPGGGGSSYSGSSASAPSTGNSYSAPSATARNFSAPASGTPTFTPATRSYSAPATPSFTPPTRSYSAPAASAPASSGGGSSGNHSGGSGSNGGGNKKNP